MKSDTGESYRSISCNPLRIAETDEVLPLHFYGKCINVPELWTVHYPYAPNASNVNLSPTLSVNRKD
jgi:hypothetical protein